jgi:hypothetical protein
MCMKCGCSTPNDKKSGGTDYGQKGGKGQTVIVPATDSTPGGYDGNNGY